MADEKKKLLVGDAHILLHPKRFRIVQLLAKKPLHINGIVKVMDVEKAMAVERRLVTYHLRTLESYEFVKSKYEISETAPSKGKAIRKYWLTDKVQKTLDELKKISLK